MHLPDSQLGSSCLPWLPPRVQRWRRWCNETVRSSPLSVAGLGVVLVGVN